MCGESFCCECCGFGDGDGNILCYECSTEGGGCDECGESMCVYCKENGDFTCCGLDLCGGEECAEKHVKKKLDCGHEGCNFHNGGCLKCKMEKDAKVEKDAVKDDIDTVKSFLGKIKSNRVKAALESIIEDPEGKKRKRDDDRVQELEFNLKKARNACNACRCGRASYY